MVKQLDSPPLFNQSAAAEMIDGAVVPLSRVEPQALATAADCPMVVIPPNTGA